MEAAKLPNFSQLKWTSANKKEEFKSLENVIVTQDGFFNKPHQDLNNINAWTYGIFYFVSKKDFHPLPTVFTPSGHGLHFPKLKMDIYFSKKTWNHGDSLEEINNGSSYSKTSSRNHQKLQNNSFWLLFSNQP
ncbi:hypothetical protein O181_029078 [Austropuccinia psidii MF-1]|uniref:Tet-like 2OG-Fe(II) oxygenase domain-containing protein n=1 Tax=Austropuccinia psidii MF-1 TaxID=1389203 RepID=A0A9Q3CSU5_9BASI|nr:hypothetical protein [Austropuccinia psidii MF-1]